MSRPSPLWTEIPIHVVDFEGSLRTGVVEYGVVTLLGGDIINTSTRLHAARTPEAVDPLRALVWSKPAYVMGFVDPVPMAFDPATSLTMRKAFFDHMWDDVTLIQVCDMLGDKFVHQRHIRQIGQALHRQGEIAGFHIVHRPTGDDDRAGPAAAPARPAA